MARAVLNRFIRRLADVLRRRPQTTVTPEMLDVAEKQRQQALAIRLDEKLRLLWLEEQRRFHESSDR